MFNLKPTRLITASSIFPIVGLAALLALSAGPSRADEPVSMSPPLQQAAVDNDYIYSEDGNRDVAAPATDTADVFNWTEVPSHHRIPINKATFDRSGYQLYDTVGETILVPFTNDNLYIMKFGVSDDGETYFVNDVNAPVLFVPRNGYLENATDSGARWYPFTDDFHPETPVYCGIAPSWNMYIDMGWYPGMYCYGGYWSEYDYAFLPTPGFLFVIGDFDCHDWDHFRHFCDDHPAPFHTDFGDHWNNRPHGPAGNFRGNQPSRGVGAFRTERSVRGTGAFRTEMPVARQFRGDQPSWGNRRSVAVDHPVEPFRPTVARPVRGVEPFRTEAPVTRQFRGDQPGWGSSRTTSSFNNNEQYTRQHWGGWGDSGTPRNFSGWSNDGGAPRPTYSRPPSSGGGWSNGGSTRTFGGWSRNTSSTPSFGGGGSRGGGSFGGGGGGFRSGRR
jgi:hypothetical protein